MIESSNQAKAAPRKALNAFAFAGDDHPLDLLFRCLCMIEAGPGLPRLQDDARSLSASLRTFLESNGRVVANSHGLGIEPVHVSRDRHTDALVACRNFLIARFGTRHDPNDPRETWQIPLVCDPRRILETIDAALGSPTC
jgi:hypothetical protein